MTAIRAYGRATLTALEEIFSIFLYSIIGGILSLFLLPIPFVVAAHYGVAHRLAESRIVSWRIWFDEGRRHARFFYRWMALIAGSLLLAYVDIRFYGRADVPGAAIIQPLMAAVFVLWFVFQPLVPIIYLEQTEKSLRLALRDSAVVAYTDPPSTLVLWGVTGLVTILIYLIKLWVLLPIVPLYFILVAVYLVRLRLKQIRRGQRGATEDQGDESLPR